MDADANLTLIVSMVLALSVSDDNDDEGDREYRFREHWARRQSVRYGLGAEVKSSTMIRGENRCR